MSVQGSRLQAGAEKLARWRRDPASMVREEFSATPDVWQLTALHLFAQGKQRLALKACKGPGKTTTLAWLICNFLACYGEPGEHPKGAAVSITKDNISANLWPEIAKWMHRSAFFRAAFTWTQSRVFANDHPETWFFEKRAFPKTADPQEQANTLAGLHARYVLFVIDESGGVPRAVMATAEAALSTVGGFKKIVQAGNPTHLEGPLWDACSTERHLWDVIEITGDPDAADRSPRISIQWAREQIAKYGADNPWVMVNVFGKFPPASINTLLGPDDIEAAKRRYAGLLSQPDTWQWSQKRIGADVARFGDDATVLFPRQGRVAFKPEQMRKQNSVPIANRIMTGVNRWRSNGVTDVRVFVDGSGGWGKGAGDIVIAAGYSCRIVLFEDRNTTEPMFYNLRAEMYWRMAEWFKGGGCLAPDAPAEIVAELTTPQYTYKDGKLLLEAKDQIKERLGRSPDYADGLALTFAEPDMPAQMAQALRSGGGRGGRVLSDWDPLADRDEHDNARGSLVA